MNQPAIRKTVEDVQSKIVDRLQPEILQHMQGIGEADSSRAVFVPTSLGEVMEFGKFMSTAHGAIPPHLRGRPADCVAVAMAAWRWKADPFAVANKTYFVNDRIAYEAQLVNAVINTNAPVIERPHVDWQGEGEDLTCFVEATFIGETRPKKIDQKLKPITVRNSPLWKSSPKQQLGYYTTRMWARLYCPEILLGIYTPDELEADEIRDPANARDVTPRPKRSDFGAVASEPEEQREPETHETYILVDEAGSEELKTIDPQIWARELIAAAAHKTRGPGYVTNNAETAEAVCIALEDQALAAQLQALYAVRKEPPGPSTQAGEAAGNGDASASSAPAASDAPAKAAADEPSPPQGEGLRPINMPMKDKKPDVTKYVEAVREELSMCTTEAEVDALMAVEEPNLNKIDRGKNGLVMQAAQRKADIAKKAAEGGQ